MLISRGVNPSGGTTEDVLGQVPDGFSTVLKFLYVCNGSATDATVSVWVTSDGNPEVYLLNEHTVPANTTEAIIDSHSGYVLQPGEHLKASSDTTDVLTVLTTIDLVYSPFELGNYGATGA